MVLYNIGWLNIPFWVRDNFELDAADDGIEPFDKFLFIMLGGYVILE